MVCLSIDVPQREHEGALQDLIQRERRVGWFLSTPPAIRERPCERSLPHMRPRNAKLRQLTLRSMKQIYPSNIYMWYVASYRGALP
jgi:hypothetical protein